MHTLCGSLKIRTAERYSLYTGSMMLSLYLDFIEPLLDYVDGIVWYYSDDGVYYNYSQIELDIMTTTDGIEVPSSLLMSVTVTAN